MAAVTTSRSKGLLTQLTTRPLVPATAGVSGSNPYRHDTRGHRSSGGPAELDQAKPYPPHLAPRLGDARPK